MNTDTLAPETEVITTKGCSKRRCDLGLPATAFSEWLVPDDPVDAFNPRSITNREWCRQQVAVAKAKGRNGAHVYESQGRICACNGVTTHG